MLGKELLDEFTDQYLKKLISNRFQAPNQQYAEDFFSKLRTIYLTYRSVFPTQCTQLDYLWDLQKSNAITFEYTILETDRLVRNMSSCFEETYKPPKLFISHAKADSAIVKIFVSLLEKIGIRTEHLFCSSIDGYDVRQGAGDIYNYLRNEMSNDGLFVIMMLSRNYYNSKVCLNEMGAAWVRQAAYQVILLPGFDFSKIKGVIKPTEMCFKLDDTDHRAYDMNELKDRILNHLDLPAIEATQWERKRNDFFSEIDALNQ